MYPGTARGIEDSFPGGAAAMISKDSLIAWLDAQGLLTADVELDIHDGFEAALRAAQAVPRRAPGRGLPWPLRRGGAFLDACRHLDALAARGGLESTEAVVALHILRATDKTLHQEISRLERRLRGGRPLPAALPATARDYLGTTAENFTTLVAG